MATVRVLATSHWRTLRGLWVPSARPPTARLLSPHSTSHACIRHSHGDAIEPPDVMKLAALAHLHVDEEEVLLVCVWGGGEGGGDCGLPCREWGACCPGMGLPARTLASPPCLPPALQAPRLTRELASMVDWFKQLQDVDVEGVPPCLQPDVDAEGWQRPDTPVTFPDRWARVRGWNPWWQA